MVERNDIHQMYAMKRIPKTLNAQPKAVMKSQITKPQITKSQITKSQIIKPQIIKSQIIKSQIIKSQIIKSQIAEYQILKVLNHPNIPTLYDIQEDEKYYYLIEEFFQGENLRTYAASHSLSCDAIISFMIQLCEIVRYLHELPNPIIHADIQPGNILIEKNNLYLVDFGNSRWKYKQEENKKCYGTPGYAAPEQYQGGILKEQSDIYGIGAICYYCLTGEKPKESLRFPKSEPVLEEIIRRCLRNSPAQRYSSVSELQYALKCLQSNQPSVKEFESLCVAVAGAISGIGVTHLSLALAGHINRHGVSCIYEECNSSKAALAIAREKDLFDSCGVYRLRETPILPYYGKTVEKKCHAYAMYIRDFGVLTEENLAEFLSADRHILLLGSKAWQIEESERKKRMLAGETNWYLVNFANQGEFLSYQHKVEETMYRIPYFPAYQDPGYAGERFLHLLFQSIAGRNRSRKSKSRKAGRKKGV